MVAINSLRLEIFYNPRVLGGTGSYNRYSEAGNPVEISTIMYV